MWLILARESRSEALWVNFGLGPVHSWIHFQSSSMSATLLDFVVKWWLLSLNIWSSFISIYFRFNVPINLYVNFLNSDSSKKVNPGEGKGNVDIIWYVKKFPWLQYDCSAAQRQQWSMNFTEQFQFNHIYFISVCSGHTYQIAEWYYGLEFDLNNALFRF